MWEHHEDTSVWSYIVNGVVIGDVIGWDENFESHIYDKEDNIIISKQFSSLQDAQQNVEDFVNGNEEGHNRRPSLIGKYIRDHSDRKVRKVRGGDWMPRMKKLETLIEMENRQKES